MDESEAIGNYLDMMVLYKCSPFIIYLLIKSKAVQYQSMDSATTFNFGNKLMELKIGMCERQEEKQDISNQPSWPKRLETFPEIA